MKTITIPPELEAPLAEAAKSQGTSLELLAIEFLRRQFAPTATAAVSHEGSSGETLYDVLKDHIGTIDSREHVPGGAQMSQETGRKFAESMAEKRREGTL